MQYFIGIDLAWGEKNSSGFCLFKEESNTLTLLELKLLLSLDEIINEIQKLNFENISIGIDAPLVVPNSTGNRIIEKEFISDFGKYKISMLPVNRRLLTKYTENIRSEVLYKRLTDLGFKRDVNAVKRVFEVYPHSTIAVCFNGYKILPYKRKKGHNTAFIKEQLKIYKSFLEPLFANSFLLDKDIDLLKGKSLKNYEDRLDAVTCAYTLYITQIKPSKIYKLDGIDTFITPI